MLSTIYAGLVFPRRDGTVPSMVTAEQFLSLLSTVNEQGTAITALQAASLVWEFDGGGEALTTGIKAALEVPFDCEITAARLFGDVSGDVVIDIWKSDYAGYPPDVGDSIVAAAKPTISGGLKYEDSTLTGWSKTLLDGNILVPNFDSVSTFQQLTLALRITRSLS